MPSLVRGLQQVIQVFQRGIGSLRRLGPVELSRRIWRRLVHAYWRQQGTMTISVGSTTNQFYSEYPTEIRVLRFVRRYERVILEDMVKELESGDVMYDVGANIGVHSCVGASTGADVVAFEPYPPNIERLESNVDLNGLAEQVDVRQVALADESGVAEFDSGAVNSPGWPWASMTTSQDTVEVAKATGDTLVSEGSIPPPNVVKIDVEGAEPLVVDGLSETLSGESCRLVYCEVHDVGEVHPSTKDFGQSIEGMTRRFEALGFDVETIYDREGEKFLRGRK